ncbi:MAG: trehalose-6-phosphate synthase [Alphaproteobacteria bacterium]|nr:trehalose-6-phosphate synthase [Alphaproteobacteria bacterium]MBV9692507.1 trehalose-6-phosphate synthase [Alphaproteobacteria bacterium]
MARTYIVSNRVSVPRRKNDNPAGGLEVALRAILKRRTGTWFGWSGSVSRTDAASLRTIEHDDLRCMVTDLTPEDYDEYYQGFANSVLWPVLHYRLDLAEFSRRDLGGYMRVNARLARELHSLLEPGDTVWVHDYHLIPFGQILRDMGHDNSIGFFLHVPLPPPEVLTALPDYQRLLGSLQAYDLVGFQTLRDVANFARFYAQEFGTPNHIGPGGELGGGAMRAGAFPVGIDAENFRALAEQSVETAYVRDVVHSIGGPLIIGVDRADYSKGIVNRFEAFEKFLRARPERRGQVTYLQIAPKSRSQVPGYAELERALEAAAGRINGDFGDARWTPIRYVNRSHTRPELAGLYRRARAGLVTPMRDGMNLVAKEYVAAQDPADPGVLILSKFAGAAAELDAALLVNPYDREAVAQAIEEALRMTLDQRRRRHERMFAALLRNDIATWGDRFLDSLDQAYRSRGRRRDDALPLDQMALRSRLAG